MELGLQKKRCKWVVVKQEVDNSKIWGSMEAALLVSIHSMHNHKRGDLQ